MVLNPLGTYFSHVNIAPNYGHRKINFCGSNQFYVRTMTFVIIISGSMTSTSTLVREVISNWAYTIIRHAISVMSTTVHLTRWVPMTHIWVSAIGLYWLRVMACCLAAPTIIRESMLNFHQWGPVALGWGQFHLKSFFIWRSDFKIRHLSRQLSIHGASELRGME